MMKYDKYKDSGIEWIGDIPEHWEVKRLKYIGYLYGGLAGKSSNHFNQISHPNNKPFIPFTNICNNIVIDPNQMQYVVIEDGEKQNTVQEGDLFFMMSSENFDDVGKSSILLHDLGETYLNSFCKGFRFTNDSYHPSFINYLLLSKPFRSLVLTEANGYTRINLKIDKINDIPVIYPINIDEQSAIASFLDRKTSEIDRIIANKQKLIALYEEEKQAIINQAVTKGLNPNMKLKDSGVEWLGQIPEHWEVKKLKLLSNKIGDGIHTTPNYLLNTELYFINGINLNNGAISILDNTMSVPIEEYEKYKIELKNGSILISLNGTIGKLAIYNGEKVIFGKSAAFIELKDSILNNFIYFILKSQYINNYFEDSFSGTTIKNLSLYTLRNTPIPFLSYEEQQSIASHIEKECTRLDTIISKFNNQIALLQEYRTTLISEVVTGKIKVSNTIES
ncbi:MAG: restriction endonuclease subunit S [Marinilabiliaceae bacterium]|nr:restriction endonuclease subunit S [Marinilabiliaceae bacterium]